MKPARREAYFSCLKTIVEHSANSIELLCKPVFLFSGRYTNFTKIGITRSAHGTIAIPSGSDLPICQLLLPANGIYVVVGQSYFSSGGDASYMSTDIVFENCTFVSPNTSGTLKQNGRINLCAIVKTGTADGMARLRTYSAGGNTLTFNGYLTSVQIR